MDRIHNALNKLSRCSPLTILLLLLGVVSACNSMGAIFPGAVGVGAPLVTADPLASETPTPFIPILPTATSPPVATYTPTPAPSPTNMLPWGSFAPPSEPSAIEIPPPMPLIQQPENSINIILLGSDQRPKDGAFRTDTMMILMLDPDNGKATMLSIPRDLYVFIPGWRVDRINTADVRGGTQWVFDAVRYNFGIELDYWVRVNFGGFITAIDALGGIYVQVGKSLYDRCGDFDYSYSPGTQYMDGYTALCYVRMRKRTSDFDRLRRQQEVVQAIFNRVLSLDGLSRVPDLYNQFNYLVQTNLTLEGILPLVPLGANLASDPSLIQRLTIDPSLASSFRVPYSGAAVLLPDRTGIQAMIRAAIAP
ncbi:MAG: hypothetical protein GTO14_00985 [Anaerolineales bacterium]|nr:hypothetical protein [Anaerolineales bacterium]